MDDIRAELKVIALSVSAIHHEQAAMNRRLDDHRNDVLRMHGQNTDRLDAINGRVRHAHELIAAIQAVIDFLKDEVKSLRARTHELGNKIQAVTRGAATDDDGKAVTRGDVKFWIIFWSAIGTAIGALIWLKS